MCNSDQTVFLPPPQTVWHARLGLVLGVYTVCSAVEINTLSFSFCFHRPDLRPISENKWKTWAKILLWCTIALPMAVVTIKEAAHTVFIVSLQIQRGGKLGKQPFEEYAGVPTVENVGVQLNTVACVVLILLKVLWSEIAAQNITVFNSVGKPSKDPTHVDYIPTLFSFTTEARRKALTKRAKKHKQVVSMKRKRRHHQKTVKVSRATEQEEVTTADIYINDERSQQAEESNISIEEMSSTCEIENDDSSLVSQCSEQVVDHSVLLQAAYQEIEELRASLRKQEARYSELERANERM